MSLIERAVQKIGTGPEERATTGTGVPDAVSSRREERSLIETAMNSAAARLDTARPAQADVRSPRSPSVEAAAPSGQPVQLPVTEATPASPRPITRIPLDTLRQRGFVTPAGRATELSQQFRVIKRPLLANAFGRGTAAVRHGKRVMVTSSLPGEGKSFCAINLAMSIAAERDTKVLLVDADVARPSIPRELGIDTGPGLMDWLIDGGPDLGSLVLQTNIETLAILSAGRAHEHATEYIASDSMARMLDELSIRYPDCLLVFDSPPLLVTTEARVLASHMGQIVMVVEAGRTPRDTVKEAIATIEGCEVVGLLLNKAAEDRPGGYYGYEGYGADAKRR